MDHRNSITNRIDQIKKNYEKNKETSQENQEGTNRIKSNYVSRGSVYDRVKFIEGQLEKCDINKTEKNFTKLTEKFGINENKFKKENSDSSQKGLESKQSIEGLNNNINNESLDFETRKRRYETVKKDQIPAQNTNMIFKSNEQMIDFLSQAKTMCEDYEKEIALLRYKLSSQTNFNKLQISENNVDNNISFIASSSNYFIKKLLEISKEASPDFNMLNAVYSDKITELFLENEKLETQIKSSIDQQDKIKESEKTIEDLKFKVKDKEIYIENMNEIYANKFTEIYNENDGLKKQIEEKNELIQNLQIKLNEKNHEFEEYKIKNLNDMNELEDYKINLETLISDKAKEIKTLKEEFEKERVTLLDNYQANKLQIEEYDLEKSNLEKEIIEINGIFNLKKNELDNLYKEYEKIKEKFEKSEEENKSLFKEIEDSKKNFDRLLSAKEEIIENFERKFAEKEDIYIKEQIYLKEKVEENEKEMVNKDLMLIQLKQDFENKSRDVVIIKGDFNTTNLSSENHNDLEGNQKKDDEEQTINMNLKEKSEEIEYLKNESKIQQKELNEKISSLNSLIQKLSEDLKTKENSIKDLEDEIKSLEKDLEKSKKKSKDAAEETDNLREIIAKDQLRIKELKEFKEKALEGKINLNSLPLDSVDSTFNIKSNKESQEIINTSEYNILLEKLKEEKSKSKVICDEYRKLQENFSILKLENSKKEKVIEANIKMIEELKVRLKNKIKLDEILLQNKNKASNTGLDTVNLGVCYNCSNQINNLSSNNFKSSNSSYINAPNLETQRARSKTNSNLPDTLSNQVTRGSIKSPMNSESKNINLNDSNINDSANNSHDNKNISSFEENFNEGLNKNKKILKINENKNEAKNRVTFEQFNLCKMLIVENLLLNYQLSHSISLNFLVEVLMKNFNFLFNTVFINGNSFNNHLEKNVIKENSKNLNKSDANNIKLNNNSSSTIDTSNGNSNIFGMNQISIFHEFLEDIILKIYDVAINNKNIESKTLNENDNINEGNKKEVKENSTNRFGKTLINLFSSKKSANDNIKSTIEDEIYKLSKEDFSFELTKKITMEVSGNNTLHNLINAHRTSKPIIQELFNNFLQKFEKHFDFEFLNISEKNTSYYEIVNIKIEDYLNNEIKSVLVDNIKNHNLNTNNKIQILIDKISQNIQDGMLLNSINKSAIYNFKYFNKQYSDFNFILRKNQETRNLNFTRSNTKNTEETNYISQMDENYILDHISENSVITNSTLIINLSNIDEIIGYRHSFDYFNFLIKSHNLEINKIAFKGDIKKNIDFKRIYNLFLNILLYNKNVQRLNFTDFYLSSDSQIRENENLRRLSIYKESYNQSLIEFINFLNYSNNVRYLTISNCYLGDEGMKYFCKNFNNFNLIELNLSKNQLKENSGFYLAELLPKLDKLETLILADNLISDPGFTSLATAISLMSLSSNNLEKKFVLKNIDLSNNLIKENESRAFVDYLSKYENLEDIELHGNSFGSQTANSIGIYLKIVKGLKRINLSKCELNDESCPLLIKNLDNSLLEDIVLDYNPLGQIGAILLGNMVRNNKYLKKISLKNCEVTAMSMTMLAKSCEFNSTLEEIDLRNNKISYEEYITMIKLLDGKRIRFLIDEVKNSK